MGFFDKFRKTQKEAKADAAQAAAIAALAKETKLFSRAMGMYWNGTWQLSDTDFAVEKDDGFYDEILKDGMLAGLLHTRLLINSTAWEVVPDDEPDDTPDRREINKNGAELVTRIIENIPRWKRFLSITLESRIKGVTFQEIVWTLKNGRTEVDYINTKAKYFFTFDRRHQDEPPASSYRFDNSVVAWIYKGDEGYMTNGEYDLSTFNDKFFIAVDNETLDNPWGRGIGHTIYWTWYFKKTVTKFWMKFMEKFSNPWLVGSTEGAVQQSHLLNILKAAANSPVIALPPDCDVKFEKVDGQAYQTFQNFIEYCDKVMAIAILGQDLTSQSPGAGGSGSYALAKVHSEVRDDIRESDLDYLNDVINYGTQYSPGLIEMILKLNYTSGVVPRVKFRLYWETETDKLQQGQLISMMIQSGMKFSPQKVAEELELEGLLAEDDEEALEAPGMGGMGDMFGGDMGEEGGFSALQPARFRRQDDTGKVLQEFDWKRSFTK